MRFGANYASLLKVLLYIIFVSIAAGLTEAINYVTSAGIDPAVSVVVVSVLSLVLKQVRHEIDGHEPGHVMNLPTEQNKPSSPT